MDLDDYKVVLYRNEREGWVAEIPAIEGCYPLMPTREEALAEFGHLLELMRLSIAKRAPPCLSLPRNR